MLVARHYAVDAAVINYTTMLSPPIHPSIHPAKKEEKSNRGESTPVFLLIIERTLTIEEAELCVRSSSYPFDVCSKKCRYGNWSSLLNRHARNGGRLLLTFWIGKTTREKRRRSTLLKRETASSLTSRINR
jgi:hypothetical protein